MAFQGVLAKDVEEGLLPVAVEGGVDVEDEGNQRADILDRHGLRMEIEEDRGLLLKQRLVEVEVAYVGFIILAILVARRLGRGPLLGGLETREGGVDLLLGGGGLAIHFLGMEQRGLVELGDARLASSSTPGGAAPSGGGVLPDTSTTLESGMAWVY